MQIRSASNMNEVNWDDPLNKGLVAWYPFRQKGGNVLRDVAGENHGTLNGSMTSDDWVASPETKSLALDFDGTDDVVTVGSTQLKSIATNSCSIVCTFKIRSDGENDLGTIFDNYTSGAGGIYLLTRGVGMTLALQGGVGFSGGDLTHITDSNAIAIGEWTTIALVYDAKTDILRLYKNGLVFPFPNTSSAGTTSGIATLDFTIGNRSAGDRTADGPISDTRIYNRALSESEVHDLYVASRTGYQDQFKRRYFPVSTTVEEPPTEETTGGLIRLKSPRQTQPSYKTGYAKSASESANPKLWDGLRGAWMPALGPTGQTLRDVTGGSRDAVESSAGTIDWMPSELGWAMDMPGTKHLSTADSGRGLSVSMEGGITASAWVFPYTVSGGDTFSDTNPRTIFQKNEVANDLNYQFRILGGRPDLTYRNFQNTGYVTVRADDHVVVANKWQHVAISRSSTQQAIYVNGVEVASTATGNQADRPRTFAEDFYIGRYEYGANRYFDGKMGPITLHDRALPHDEIKQLHADPLAPFRQRRYAPVSLQPLTLLEKIRSVAKPTTTRALSVKKNSVPSYKAGYAKSASESANPELWDGLRGAWYPQMGESGSTLMDLSGGKMNASRIGQIDWLQSNEDGGLTCDYFGRDAGAGDSSAFDIVNSSSVHPYGDIGSEFTIICRVRRDANNKTIPEDNWYVGNTVFELRQETTAGCNVPFSVGQKAVATDEVYWSIGFTDNFTTNAEKVFSDVNVGNVNTWTHGAVTVSNNTVQWYSKGEPWGGGTISTATGDRSVGSVASNMQIGSGCNSTGIKEFNEFGGRISEVLLYDRVLTHREIKQLYVDPLAPFRKKTTVGYQPSKELRGLFRT